MKPSYKKSALLHVGQSLQFFIKQVSGNTVRINVRQREKSFEEMKIVRIFCQKQKIAELLRVLGPDVPVENMGRMIDPYLIEDRHEPGLWWCFFKSRGEIMYSQSTDLVHWIYRGKAAAGENPCVILHDNRYLLFYSPNNGIRCKSSDDMINWEEAGQPVYLGQDNWPWAQGRITAGFVLDLKNEPKVGKYLMFFHGSQGPNRGETILNFDIHSHIGLAWSDDLVSWSWAPGDTG